MNILLVHNFYLQPGGEDQVFAEEGAMLEARGNTVARFTMDNDAIDGVGKLQLLRKTIWNREAQIPLKEAIRKISAQVVHFHNTFPLISPAAYYSAHEEGAAVVQTLHNYRLLCPTATFYRDGAVCEQCLGKTIPWPGVVHKCYRQNRMASAAVATMLGYHNIKKTWQKEVDLYIALTEFSRRKFIEGGLPEDKIVVKPNFVDPDPGVGKGDGENPLFVGRLTEEKGIRILLEAGRILNARGGHTIRVVGDGPMRGEVEKAALEKRGIEYLGRRPAAEVYVMMGSSPALIFPSTWYEGQPKTIIESLAKGTPVVASRLGSMPEMIEHGKTGLLFEPGDAEELARQTESLLGDPASRQEMRRAAREQYEARYTAARNYDMLANLYERAQNRLTRRPAPSRAAGEIQQ